MMAGALLIAPQILTLAAHQPPAVDTIAVGGDCAAGYSLRIRYVPIHSGIMRQRDVLWSPPTNTILLPGVMAGLMRRRIYNHSAIRVTAALQAARGGGGKSLQPQPRRPRGWLFVFTRKLFGFSPRATG